MRYSTKKAHQQLDGSQKRKKKSKKKKQQQQVNPLLE
jgi:hypothetical protein